MATLHSQISNDLREQITSGTLLPGAALPSESELMRSYDVSRITVRQALQTLEQEGLVEAQAGRGRTVRTRRNMVYRPQAEFEPRQSTTSDRYITSLTLDGRKPSQTIEIAIDEARGIVADRLGVTEGTPVAVRKRVRSIDGEPFNLNDTYYVLDKVKDTAIMSPRDLPEGSNTVARKAIGREVRTLDEFYIRMPTPDETRRLNLNPGTPVAVHYATGYTADDETIRVEYHVLPGDRHVIVYERHYDGVE